MMIGRLPLSEALESVVGVGSLRKASMRRIAAQVGIFRRTDIDNLPWRLTRGAFGPAYGVRDLQQKLERMGVPRGTAIMVHSSWKDFRHFAGTPVSLIDGLLEYVGPDGTVMMPAFPARQDPTQVFDVKRTPTGAGFIPEVFRRADGVLRSISLNHSCCAKGPAAEYLTRDHHLGETSFDEHSPFYRLAELGGFTVTLGLGRPFGLGTVVHCAESVLRFEIPRFAHIFAEPVTYRYRDSEGQLGEHTYRPRADLPWRFSRVEPHLRPRPYLRGHLSSLQIQVIRARDFRDQVIALARRGITCHY